MSKNYPISLANGSQVVSITGRDRVLAANKDYLIVVTNTGSGSVDADYFLTWAEVIPDLPLP